MSVNELVYDMNQQLTEDELVPVMEALDDIPHTTQDVERFCDALGIDSAHLYYNAQGMPAFFYYNHPRFTEIYSLDIHGEDDDYLKMYKQRIIQSQKMFDEQEWDTYFYVTKGLCSTLLFKETFAHIAPDKQYGVLKHFYVSQYSGHSHITPDLWARALESRGDDYTPALPYEADEYVIYRGSGTLSVAPDTALSWTLDLMTAAKFAYRSKSQPVIYKTTIKREDIVDYFDDRSEHEVIVEPENLGELEKLEQKESFEMYTELLQANLIEEFNLYRNTLVKKENFLHPSDLHGASHTGRVLLHVLALAFLSELSTKERAILANAAIYHDIGRTHDGVDPYHGEKSRELVEENYLPLLVIDCIHPEQGQTYSLDNFSNEEEEMIKLIMAYHAKEDTEGLAEEVLTSLSPEGREQYKRLYLLFKDADGLDRVRLADINDNYLRTTHAPSLITFAMRIYETLK